MTRSGPSRTIAQGSRLLQFLERRAARIAESRALRSQVIAALSARLDLQDGDLIRVAEVGCADPGCADTETIALLMRPGRPSQAVKVAKSMLDLAPPDLDDLAAQLVARCGGLARVAP